MSIRIGSSCALNTSMALGRCVETRKFIGSTSGWEAVCKQAIRDKQYLILTLCINRNDMSGHYPGDIEWINFVSTACTKLKSFGGRSYNSRISLVNEPMKFITREQYAHLINLAYPIVKGHGFLVSCGNEEFLTAQAKGDMYPYILQNCMFDILDIHIQGSCDTPEKTEYWCNTASQWVTQYGRKIDCTEAFYADIATSKGWTLLTSMLENAERIGCPNFCNVFNNLVRSAFPTLDTTKWDKLCFNIDGVNQSGYWLTWQSLMDSKAPVPNINEMIIIEDDDMKLDSLYYKDRPLAKYVRDPAGRGIMFLRKCFHLSDSNVFDTALDSEVRNYQLLKGFIVDGKVGPETFSGLILEADYQKFYNYIHHNWATYS